MKFNSITINNFRQYYQEVLFDLNTEENKNIILIGGRNGYGKTNLLISLVWCLYGDKISQVDDYFRKEIQKEKNYNQFMRQSLNWEAQKNDLDSFFVELKISGLELPPINSITGSISEVIIKRSFNTKLMDERLSIYDAKNKISLFNEDIDNINFINDFIVPFDAAKFVFFDAEKIGAMAELSTKEEGSVLNDALGKILGLDLYEDLIDDLKSHSQFLTRDAASGNIQEQIIDREETLKREKNGIDQFEEKNAEILVEIEKLKVDIRNYELFINQHSNESDPKLDRELYLNKKNKLEHEIQILEQQFNELSEVIPLAILTGHIEEINDHLKLQESKDAILNNEKDNIAVIDQFIERLFNNPPDPINSSFSFKDKMFYYEKARALGLEMFKPDNEDINLSFEHDLSNTEKDLLYTTLKFINIQSKDLFQATIDNYNKLTIELNDLLKIITKIDADLEDEIIVEYLTKKQKAERQLSEHNQSIGSNNEKIKVFKKNIIRLNQEYQTLLEKVEISQKNRIKLTKTKQYINALQSFVDDQKEQKKDSLAKNILEELQKLMHKLQFNQSQFVTDIKVSILADGGGMKVTLYNSEDLEIKKEVLSQGEKQLYISSLIKAILKESLQSLPIFIDTPLGRLDDEHIKNTLLYYYPDLTEQVVILSTNNEITPRRYNDIAKYVSKTYLLENENGRTSLKNGYFKNA